MGGYKDSYGRAEKCKIYEEARKKSETFVGTYEVVVA
jgi:hypothetical protein